MNEKLTKIGNEVGISEKDISALQAHNNKKKNLVKKAIYIVVGVLIAAITFILGYFWLAVKNQPEPEKSGYPYSLNPIFLGFLLPKGKKAKIAGLLAGIILFLTTIKIKYALGQDQQNLLWYDVYNKN